MDEEDENNIIETELWERGWKSVNKYFGEYKMANAQTNRTATNKNVQTQWMKKNAASTEQTTVKMENIPSTPTAHRERVRAQKRFAFAATTLAHYQWWWLREGKAEEETDNMLAYNAKNFFV